MNYIEFLEILSSNEHPSMKHLRIEQLMFNKFYDKFLKIENSRNLNVDPNLIRRDELWKELHND